MPRVYLIGSLRNAAVPLLGHELRKRKWEVFDDWHSAGPEADDHWLAYEKAKGCDYRTALSGAAAKNVFAFDKRNLDLSDAAILVLPAGKSGHLELGYMAGQGTKFTAVLFAEEPDRWDVMYQFANRIYLSPEELLGSLKLDYNEWLTLKRS